jgi:hypothetical protein
MFVYTFLQRIYHQTVDQSNMCYEMNLCNNETTVDPCPYRHPVDQGIQERSHQTSNIDKNHPNLTILKYII